MICRECGVKSKDNECTSEELDNNLCWRCLERNKKNDETVYYSRNGVSPVECFKKGLLSKEEFKGFCKGNVIKYTVRCDSKGDYVGDLDKAISYLELLKELK